MERQIIHPKEVQLITGKSEKHGRMLIKKIKELHNKSQHQVVTVEEFCNYLGLDFERVRKMFK